MAARLGNVLYWAGCGLAVLALILGTLTAIGDSADTDGGCSRFSGSAPAIEPADTCWPGR